MENTGSTNSTPVADTVESTEASNIEGTNNEQETQAQASPQPKLSRKIKLKIDGQDFEETLPFDYDESNKDHVDYLKRQLQMSKVAQKRMNEASLTRKQAEQFINKLKSDPMAILNDDRIMGQAKFREIAEQFLLKQIEQETLSPEERRHKEMESKLKSYEEQERKQREEAEAKQAQQLEEHYAQQYQKTIIDALNSSSLPKNPFTVKRMAELMQKNIQHGLELEPAHLAQIVRDDYQKELVSLIGGSDADQILAMFGEDVANKIRKSDLAKLKAGQIQPKPSNNQPKAPTADMPLTMSEWRRKNGHG